jgi:hypothetical protein
MVKVLKTGMLYNAFVCLALFVCGILTSRAIWRRRRDQSGFMFFSLFWFLMGVMWGFVGIRTIFAWAGKYEIDKFIFSIVTIFMILHLWALVSYLSIALFKKGIISRWLILTFTVLSILYLSLFFGGEVHMGSITYWASEWVPPKGANLLFGCTIFPLLVVEAVSVLLKNLYKKESSIILSSIAISIYIWAGVMDALGALVGWRLLGVRVLMMISSLMAYISFSGQDMEEAGF